MRPTKACPVVIRRGALGDEVLAFRHPVAGVQLVKGTIEVGEPAGDAALRELEEESGIVSAELARSLGVWSSGYDGQIWEFFEVRVPESLPVRWRHFAHDDGGHEFQFFWHALAENPTAEWHSLFVAALEFIRVSRRGVVTGASRGGLTSSGP
jgi:8-oxo-dGTP pyrophosphatase MutT (NUDIX family)